MAQFARPDSDVDNGAGWSPSTGATLFGVLDEVSADDGDFITSNDNSNDNVEVGLSSVTDPEDHTGHIVRYRFQKDAAGGHAVNAQVILYQGATQIAAGSVHTGITASWAQGAFTLTTGEAGNITDYSDLRLRIYREGGSDTGGPPGNRRAIQYSWAELEVPDAPAAGPTEIPGAMMAPRVAP